jgi:succinate dehydrogenase / fumarate reductase cytochrome b subunit
MAVTGVILFAFILGHLAGNLQVFEGPAKFDAYAIFLRSLPAALWSARIILLVSVTLHIVATIQLALLGKSARAVSYVKKDNSEASYASRTMYWSGPIVLAFIIFHLLQFTAGYIHPHATFTQGEVYSNVVSGFQVWWVSLWYIIAVGLLCLHLSHGIWSMFQSVGLAHKRHTVLLKRAAQAIAILIFLGYSSIPISVYLGFVK